MSDDEYQSARELESKFTFYFTALTFTILGLAIQTAPESAPSVARVFELSAWLLLLAAGLVSLWYLENFPIRRLLRAELLEVDAEIRQRSSEGADDMLLKSRHTSRLNNVPTHDLRRSYKHRVAGLQREGRREHLKYKIARICLVAGLIATAIARGYPLVQEIAGVVKPAESKLILTTPN